jgi:hypothetical protein
MTAFDPLTAPLSEVQQKLEKMSCPADIAEMEYHLITEPERRDLYTRLIYCLVKTRDVLEKMQIANHGFKGNSERKAVLAEVKMLESLLAEKQAAGKGTKTLERQLNTTRNKAQKLKYAPAAGSKLAGFQKSKESLQRLLSKALKSGLTKKDLMERFPDISYVMKGKV